MGRGEVVHEQLLRHASTVGRVRSYSGLHRAYDEWAEIAYVFSPLASGAGYATEAVEWMIADLHQRGFCELWAAVHPDNAASLRLLERVGLTETDHLARPVGSYDDGDLILWRTGGAARQPSP